MQRRTLLKTLAAAPFLGPVLARAQAPPDLKAIETLQRDWKMLLAAGTAVPAPTEPLKRPNEEWRKVLTPQQYNVLREEGTERPGTSPLNGEKRPGVFGTKRDFKLIYPRTEYHCIRCGGHHGHLFDDGPKPTGLRYCNNGVALRFIPNTGWRMITPSGRQQPESVGRSRWGGPVWTSGLRISQFMANAVAVG